MSQLTLERCKELIVSGESVMISSRLFHGEDQIDDLTEWMIRQGQADPVDVVAAHQEEIDALKAKLARLEGVVANPTIPTQAVQMIDLTNQKADEQADRIEALETELAQMKLQASSPPADDSDDKKGDKKK